MIIFQTKAFMVISTDILNEQKIIGDTGRKIDNQGFHVIN